MRAIVIGGGGNKGAAGSAKCARINEDFDLGIGVSTGALMLVPVMMKEWELLHDTYTQVNQNDIFDKGKNPFKRNGHVKILYTAWRILSGAKTLGETQKLKDILYNTLTLDMYHNLKLAGKEAVVGVYCNDDERMEYYSSADCDYDDFIHWTWTSALQPPAMSIYNRNGKQYVDGGVQEVFPMVEAVNMGASHITGILHRPRVLPKGNKVHIKNIAHHIYRLIIGMRREITNNDIARGVGACMLKDIPYELHFVTQGYGENDLVFNPEKMSKWWDDAYKEKLLPVTDWK